MQLTFNSNPANIFRPSRQRFGVSTLIFMLLFGAIFIAAGWLIRGSLTIDPSWTRVTGQVVDAARSSSASDGYQYTPIVQYQVNGQTYKISGGISSSAYPHIGTAKTVAYNPAHPQEAKLDEGAMGNLFLYVPFGVGLLCIVLGPVLFAASLRRGQAIRNLKQSGQKIQGVIVDILGANRGYRVAVSATGPDGTVQTYTSDPLAGLGGFAMTDFHAHPIPIDVYVDPANPQSYYVDISELPNLTPERIAELIQSATKPPAPQI